MRHFCKFEIVPIKSKELKVVILKKCEQKRKTALV